MRCSRQRSKCFALRSPNLRAVFRSRPMTDEEVADPSTIPADASFDFGDVDVDLEGLSEDDMKAWTLNYIDAQAIPPARRTGRKQKGGNMNDTRENSQDLSLKRQDEQGARLARITRMRTDAAKSASTENASSADRW